MTVRCLNAAQSNYTYKTKSVQDESRTWLCGGLLIGVGISTANRNCCWIQYLSSACIHGSVNVASTTFQLATLRTYQHHLEVLTKAISQQNTSRTQACFCCPSSAVFARLSDHQQMRFMAKRCHLYTTRNLHIISIGTLHERWNSQTDSVAFLNTAQSKYTY